MSKINNKCLLVRDASDTSGGRTGDRPRYVDNGRGKTNGGTRGRLHLRQISTLEKEGGKVQTYLEQK